VGFVDGPSGRRARLAGDPDVDRVVRARRLAEGQAMPDLIYASDHRFTRNGRFMAEMTEALFRAASEHRAAREGGVCWLE
jgi:hypothetical protein